MHSHTVMQTDAAADVRQMYSLRVWEKEDSVKAAKPSEQRAVYKVLHR